jgi:hypothetical protein
MGLNMETYALLLILIVFNSLITRDLYNWVLPVKKRVVLILLVWLVPVLGFFVANQLGNLGWFKSRKPEGGNSSIASGIMLADSVFNPGRRHTIEIIEKQKSEIQHEHKQVDDDADNAKKHI